MSGGRIEVTAQSGLPAQETRAVLEALPRWFGRPASTEAYVEEAERLPCIAAREGPRLVGFASLKPANVATCEFAVMAVRPEHHRTGVGRRIVEAGFAWMEEQGYRLGLVQTVGAGAPSLEYAMTRQFYLAMGFMPLIELAELFGPGTPALLLVRPLGAKWRVGA